MLMKVKNTILLLLLISNSFLNYGMHRNDLRANLKDLSQVLTVLSNKLEGSTQYNIKSQLSFLPTETIDYIIELSGKLGLSPEETVKQSLALLAGKSSSCPTEETSPGSSPPLPPPPPPITTAPQVLFTPGEILTRQPTTLDIAQRIAGLSVSREPISEEELTEEQKQKSDEQLFNIFRNAADYDSLLKLMQDLITNKLYFKKEALIEDAKKQPSTPFEEHKAKKEEEKGIQRFKGILELLSKISDFNSKLLTPEYLKRYLFQPDLFSNNDRKRLDKLIEDEKKRKKEEFQERRRKRLEKYIPWERYLKDLIIRANTFDQILNQIIKFGKPIPEFLKIRDVISPDKFSYIVIPKENIKEIETLFTDATIERSQKVVDILKTYLTDQYSIKKLNDLFQNYERSVNVDLAIINLFKNDTIKSSRQLYEEIENLLVTPYDDDRIKQPLLELLGSLTRTRKKIFSLIKKTTKRKSVFTVNPKASEAENPILIKIRNKIEPYGFLIMVLEYFEGLIEQTNDPKAISKIMENLKNVLIELNEKEINLKAYIPKNLLKKFGIGRISKENYKNNLTQAINALDNKDANNFIKAIRVFITNADTPGLQEKYNIFAQSLFGNLEKGFAAQTT